MYTVGLEPLHSVAELKEPNMSESTEPVDRLGPVGKPGLVGRLELFVGRLELPVDKLVLPVVGRLAPIEPIGLEIEQPTVVGLEPIVVGPQPTEPGLEPLTELVVQRLDWQVE